MIASSDSGDREAKNLRTLLSLVLWLEVSIAAGLRCCDIVEITTLNGELLLRASPRSRKDQSSQSAQASEEV